MVNIRLLTIILLGLLFVMHGVRDFPFALAQDEATALASDREVQGVSAQKELVDDHGVTSFSMGKLWLQGRKMAAHMLWKEYEKEPKAMDKFETSKISGKSRSEASKKSFQRFDHNQDDDQRKNINMLDRKTLRTASLGIPRSKPAVSLSNSKQMQPQDSKTVKPITSLESSSMSENLVAQEPLDADDHLRDIEETKRFLMAAKDVENLMQKDYRGMSKPGRKPPINNHEPRH